MIVEAVIVGSELCNGDLSDTHAARFGVLLRDHGLRLSQVAVVPDDTQVIGAALRAAWERCDLLLVSGGLGPTSDDITLAAAATAAGVQTALDAEAAAQITAWYGARDREVGEAQLAMARIPDGARALTNPVGSAPAVWWTRQGCDSLFLPGVPREVDRLLEDHLRPWLRAHPAARPWRAKVFRTFGAGESRLASALDGLRTPPGGEIAYRASFPEVLITARIQEGTAAPEERAAWLADIQGRLAEWTYGDDPSEGLAHVVGRLVSARGLSVALAESCTGGLMSAALTEVPGASGWFLEGAVTYANEAKMHRLGVTEALLQAHGAVSEEVARAMARGARDQSGADIAVAITGIAGPGGGSPEKPVGTVHFALSSDHGEVHLCRNYPYGDRSRNRRISTWQGLDLLRRELLRHHT